MVDNTQQWDHLSFRFLTPDVVKAMASLGEDHDIHFECLGKSDDLQIVTIDTRLGHCLHVLFIGSVNLFRSRPSGHGRGRQRAVILAFRISTRTASGMDDKECFEAVGIVFHILDCSITKLCIRRLISVELVRKGVE